jgi:hypothetical protein
VADPAARLEALLAWLRASPAAALPLTPCGSKALSAHLVQVRVGSCMKLQESLPPFSCMVTTTTISDLVFCVLIYHTLEH